MGIIFFEVVDISNRNSKVKELPTISLDSELNQFQILIDSCEYIIIKEGDRGYMSHKGNCKHCNK